MDCGDFLLGCRGRIVESYTRIGFILSSIWDVPMILTWKAVTDYLSMRVA